MKLGELRYFLLLVNLVIFKMVVDWNFYFRRYALSLWIITF